MKTNNAKKQPGFERELTEMIKDLQFRFVKMSGESRKEIFERFDVAIEGFKNSPHIRDFFINLKAAFQGLAAKN